ncbi:hypothetical protein [Wolbachia endosymbiont (group E) of Neria commutata]|uniref:hypothetical protein n=1 Tax=Wolbachia endosymbiont (group E) of Neria commutata TaxID=3066149 RepID=UPI003132989F
MLNAAAIKAYLYAKNGGKKPTINLKKEGEKLFLIGTCAALAFTAWFYIPALSSVLLYFLVPLTFYFLYNIYNFLKNCLHKLLNKDNKTHDENREAINVIAMDQPSQTVRIIRPPAKR